MKKVLDPGRWLGELPRVSLVTVLAVVVTLLVAEIYGVREGSGGMEAFTYDLLVIWLIAYFASYTLLTWVVFHLAPGGRIAAWARSEERGTWAQRYVYGTAPGPGMSIFVGVAALLVAVLWLPGDVADASAFPATVRTVLGIVLVVVAWLTVAVSFTVAYLAEDLQSEGAAMAFPGTKDREWRPLSDYAYVSVALSTTFGTTDVSLTTTEVRRTAMVHALVAFIFNSVVLAIVVSVLLG